MSKKKNYKLKAKLWLYPGESGNWHFLTIPKDLGKEIKETHGKHARGFGSLPVEVTVGTTVWSTSIFPDKSSGSYLLPVKAAVRKKEDIEVGEEVVFSIEICS